MINKGVFWITEDCAEEYFFRIPCDLSGNVVGETEYPLCSKDGTNYNHKALWAVLPKSLTRGKPFDYFPRGRVEIRGSKAFVYLNPDVNTEEIQELIKGRFGLTEPNGIQAVRFISDGSRHYRHQTG